MCNMHWCVVMFVWESQSWSMGDAAHHKNPHTCTCVQHVITYLVISAILLQKLRIKSTLIMKFKQRSPRKPHSA